MKINPTAGSYSTLKDWKKFFHQNRNKTRTLYLGNRSYFILSHAIIQLFFSHPHSFLYLYICYTELSSLQEYQLCWGSLILMFFFQPSFAPLKCLFPLKFCLFFWLRSTSWRMFITLPLFKLHCDHLQAVILHTVLSVYNPIMGTNSLRVELFQVHISAAYIQSAQQLLQTSYSPNHGI